MVQILAWRYLEGKGSVLCFYPDIFNLCDLLPTIYERRVCRGVEDEDMWLKCAMVVVCVRDLKIDVVVVIRCKRFCRLEMMPRSSLDLFS